MITGAARGIGKSIAERLVLDGFDITLIDIDPMVEEVAAALGARFATIDLTSREAVTQLAAVAESGPFWALVNNAGVFDNTPLLELDLERWDFVQSVNARSMVVTMKALAPGMITARGGRIINMASMAAKLGTSGESAYAASKAAVVALTRIASAEFGEYGITANSISPGYILTEMGADTRTEADIATWSALSPLGRLGQTDDVASLVAFLVSDDASYLTGQALNVTGGMCTT